MAESFLDQKILEHANACAALEAEHAQLLARVEAIKTEHQRRQGAIEALRDLRAHAVKTGE